VRHPGRPRAVTEACDEAAGESAAVG